MKLSKLFPYLFVLTLVVGGVTAKEVDFVKLGKDTFHAVGCAECHSEIKNDSAVKTGPGLYGVFQKVARKREIMETGENHRHTIAADLKYFKKSLRKPHTELAIAELGATKGQPYLPVMPPYAAAFVSDEKARAMYQYLLTLNDEKNRGPAKLMAEFKEAGPLKPELDPAEILVTDRTRIYRARLAHSSARAVSVGVPTGLNYTFDPRSLSIERIWWGGFINLAKELDGRAGKLSSLGHQAMELPRSGPLLHPLHPETKKPVDLSFKSPKAYDYKTIVKNLYGKEEFLDQLKTVDADFLGYKHADQPVFSYRVGKNKINLRFSASTDGKGRFTLDGKLSSPQTFVLSELIGGGSWTVHSLPAIKNFKLPKPTTIWRPQGAAQAPKLQKLESKPCETAKLPSGYSAESITPPVDVNGRPQLFEPMGMATSADGGLVLTTRTAGVWKLNNGEWMQIAEGTLDALGVIVEEDCLIVAQKPELTRLRDLDGDGRMDVYETLSDDFLYTSNYYEYLHGPAKGSDGNYYIQTNLSHHFQKEAIYKAGGQHMGTQGGYRAWSLQVTPKGKMTPFARGLRSPAGLGTGPDGRLYYIENQGEYVGTSKVFHLEQDKFYGHPSGLVDLPGLNPDSPELQWDAVKAKKEMALVLLPHSRLANSPGSPVWDTTGGKFGPFTGDMFVGDQTLSNVFRVLLKPGNEGAVIPFAQGFPSGVMRMVFDENGSLFVGQTGRGWRAKGGEEAALVRVYRNDDPVVNQLKDVTRKGDSFTLHFIQPLESGGPSVKVNSWFYIDSPKYGSAEHGKRAEEMIASPSLSADRKSLTLHFKEQEKLKHQRVYHFEAPGVSGSFEAFYTRSPDKP